MKNFEMWCAVEGSSALQPKFEHTVTTTGAIIEFPKQETSLLFCPSGACNSNDLCSPHPFMQAAHRRIAQSDMVQSLRYGTIQGRSYDRVKPWQAALIGCLFFATSIASIFLGL